MKPEEFWQFLERTEVEGRGKLYVRTGRGDFVWWDGLSFVADEARAYTFTAAQVPGIRESMRVFACFSWHNARGVLRGLYQREQGERGLDE